MNVSVFSRVLSVVTLLLSILKNVDVRFKSPLFSVYMLLNHIFGGKNIPAFKNRIPRSGYNNGKLFQCIPNYLLSFSRHFSISGTLRTKERKWWLCTDSLMVIYDLFTSILSHITKANL